jgi:hypothetical protein
MALAIWTAPLWPVFSVKNSAERYGCSKEKRSGFHAIA